MNWQVLMGLARNACVISVVLGAMLTRADADNWPRYRGENGSGVSGEKGLPKTWSPGEYAWNIELPGEGHSSPVIWDNRVFVTSAIDEGAVRYLICLDAKTGDELWTQAAGFNRSLKHVKSSWASATPATDGERVYVLFADKESFVAAAYDFDGNLAWRRNIGRYESHHGQGASPIVFEDLLIVPNDQDGPSSILALDRRTGETVWSALRTSVLTSYATPIVVQGDGFPPQLVCSSSTMGITSLDPTNGQLNWASGEMPARTVSSPLFDGKAVIQQCGSRGGGALLTAVNPFSIAEGGKPNTVFSRTKNLPYVPTPIAYENHLYLWNDNGVVHCLKGDSGDIIWTKRIGGNFTGSPICVDGTLYIISEEGKVVVIAASPRYEKYGESLLDDPSHSTPAMANGRLYLRTFHRLACLEARP
jgi:outer membrane protein assembly factor BamB